MSRHVVTIGAIFLILAGLVPKLAAVVAALPQPVLGGATVVMFGMIASAGMVMAQAGFNSRNMLIVPYRSVLVLVCGRLINLRVWPVLGNPMIVCVVAVLLFVSGIVVSGIIAAILNALMSLIRR